MMLGMKMPRDEDVGDFGAGFQELTVSGLHICILLAGHPDFRGREG